MSNENNTDDWKPYRIIPQSVLVRQVTDPEGEMILSRNQLKRVRAGDYVVRLANGLLRIANQEAFAECYEPEQPER